MLIECVPNFSEGRHRTKVDRIVEAIQAVEGATVLDVELDPDHNRSVVTFVGEPRAVGEAAFRAAAAAVELIDLNRHSGEHPRMGAVDVIPFVPLSGATMEDCVALAGEVGARIGRELELPVFLYERAATRPDRENLADVRRGEFEGLREAIGRDPERRPDFGPERIHPTAGAVAVGARTFLIAYNVNLATADLSVADRIARALRHSSGGFRYVKAMGVELKARGIVQVSMNLTDHTRTPPARVFEAVRREAERWGVSVIGSEIVGLVPAAALHGAAEWFLRLEGFSPSQVIENRLAEVAGERAHRADHEALLGRLAARTPTPGGGSAAAFAGAMAAALGEMVARLTLGKPRHAAVATEMADVAERARALRRRLAELVEEDARSFEGVLAAGRLPRSSEAERAERERAIRAATLTAARVPLETMRAAREALELAERAARLGSAASATDAAAGALLARAALRAARLNVDVNLKGLAGAEVDALTAEAARLDAEVAGIEERALAAAAQR